MTSDRNPPGEIRYYRHISCLVITALALAGVALLWLNSVSGRSIVQVFLGPQAAFGLHLFFWGALGGAIASSLFLARDKEDNELESLKATPDVSLLRYPTNIDVHLYGHRILTSACLAVVGALFLYAGLSYFDVPPELPSPKHRAFFMLFAFLVGLYQGNFVKFLNKRFQRILDRSAERESGAAAQLPEKPKGSGTA